MTYSVPHRLDGLEPDNLLAFLALLGLLRSLEAVDKENGDSEKLLPRASWDLAHPPLRPVLHLQRAMEKDEVGEAAAKGIALLSKFHVFGGAKDLNYPYKDARALLKEGANTASSDERNYADLLASLFSDAAIKGNKKDEVIDPTPLCLLFGQGHQHFLERLASVPNCEAPPPRGRGKSAKSVSAARCLEEALFQPWHREDPTDSLRWDPEEGVRYALMAGDPTDAAYKSGTQHGANRLACIGLAALTLVPRTRAGHVRSVILGGTPGRRGGFSFSWPIWKEPASLASIRGLLGHPGLLTPGSLSHLSVDHVFTARRISIGKFMNFTRAKAVDFEEAG